MVCGRAGLRALRRQLFSNMRMVGGADIPFIICTVHDEISASCRAGVHVVKPTNVEELVNIMEQLIHRDSS
jgi:hypothetical protein